MKDPKPEKDLMRFRIRKSVLYGVDTLALLGLWLTLSGCGDFAYWNARTFWGLDCRPEVLKDGKCVPVKKGGSGVKTAQP